MNSSVPKVLLVLSCFLYLASAQNETTSITEHIEEDAGSWLHNIMHPDIMAKELDLARNTVQEYIDIASNALATTEVVMNTVVDSLLRLLNFYELYTNPSLKSATDAAKTGIDLFESITSPIPIVGNVVSSTVDLGKSVAQKANDVGQAVSDASESLRNAFSSLTGGLLDADQNNDTLNATDATIGEGTGITGSLFENWFG